VQEGRKSSTARAAWLALIDLDDRFDGIDISGDFLGGLSTTARLSR
jgi:hypothetical protein